jgi:quercetin dioxygenase-like cupin family protein
VLVRAGEAERLDSIGHVLLADSSDTASVLSSHRVALGCGADGAVPHRHDNSSEFFYILDGTFDLLVEEEVVTARTGDLLVVPPGVAHAFAAHRGSTAEALVIATPGIERFDYFRHVVRRREGSESAEVLLGLQDRFDTHFLESSAWQRARSAT